MNDVLHFLYISFIHVAGDYIEASSSARNIGVIFDTHINLEKHVMNTCKMAFYHLRNKARIRNCLSQDDAETLVHTFISSKLDFCSALLYGLHKSVINRLQYAQNCAARLVTRTRSSEHITPVLRRLHWLPVRQQITYKILLLTYKALRIAWRQPSALNSDGVFFKKFACNTEVEPKVLRR